MKGRLWWVATDEEELREWRNKYFNREGIEVIKTARMPKEGPCIHIILELEKLYAHRLLDYIPAKEEWLAL